MDKNMKETGRKDKNTEKEPFMIKQERNFGVTGFIEIRVFNTLKTNFDIYIFLYFF